MPPPDQTPAAIEAVDLQKAYPGRRVLTGVNLSVCRGEVVAILGPSGSGKSTLLALLGLLDRPDAGKIRLSGEDVGMSSSAKRARLRHEQIGFVFQDVNLIQHLSVRANLELAVGGDNLPRAIALLDEFGLPDVAKAKPTRLSLGEQQRVAVARALAKDSSVVLADEPTSSLDPGNRDAVLRALRSAADHGAGVVIVTHDQAVADWADRRLEIDPARGTLSGGGTT